MLLTDQAIADFLTTVQCQGGNAKRDGSCPSDNPVSANQTTTASQSTSPSSTQSSSAVSTIESSSSSSLSTKSTITQSTFITSTTFNTCTYQTPNVTSPYCTNYKAESGNECHCDDDKTYAPYTKDNCQPVCPLISPADGYSEMTPAPTTTAPTSFTTTDIVGNVQICTSVSTIGLAHVCIGPTISTATTAAAPAATTSVSCESDGVTFTTDQADAAIEDMCDPIRTYTLNAGENVPYLWGASNDDSPIEMELAWSIGSGDLECNSQKSTVVTSQQCKTYFHAAVDACDKDSDNKHGASPFTWNSPNGCINFRIFGQEDS
ncbi:hypothetical protein F5Y15DRAFT_367307 [Xylariaceae sp. FL0016]|nr:hypothetical protein F5Y15DRAFT_367307 [Xylariaceae sp. FL0016]